MSARAGGGARGTPWPLWLSLSLIVLDVLVLAGVGLLAGGILAEEQETWRGVAVGTPPRISHAQDRSLGIHLDLAELEGSSARQMTLERVRDLGLSWVRVDFPWWGIEPSPGERDWALWDEAVEAFGLEGLKVVAVLKGSPQWARLPVDREYEEAPPADLEDFNRFAGAVAARYKGKVHAYQIWDEPNTYPHWGNRFVDPEGYARMLAGASAAVREEDTQALILTASLAPNVEDGPINMNESLFLKRLYEEGAGPHFDVLALEPYGLWTGPDDRRVGPGVLNFSRALLGREVMIRHGDAEKAMWGMAFGWNSLPQGWEGLPSPWGSDDEQLQAERLRGALGRARTEWPWMGPMFWPRLSPPPDPGDPEGGFALVDGRGQPRLAYAALREAAALSSTAQVGWTGLDNPAVRLDEGWTLQDGGARAARAGAELNVSFQGTRLDALWETTPEGGSYEMWVDGQPAGEVPDGQLDLGDSIEQEKRLTVARDLTFEPHTVRIVANEATASRLLGFIVAREVGLTSLRLALGLAMMGLSLMLYRLGKDLARLPLRRWMTGASLAYLSLGEGWQIAAMAATILALQFVPVLPIQLAAAACLTGLVWLRLDLGLVFLVLAVPFFLQPVRLGSRAFSLVEILTVFTFAAWLSQTLIRWWDDGTERYTEADQGCRWQDRLRVLMDGSLVERARVALSRWTLLDAGVAALALVSVGSLSASTFLGVSLRELRVVILEPILLYVLLRNVRLDRRTVRRLVDAWILASVLISLWGLYQYVFTGDVILVEGVRRIRSVYASPNNLSLFLGRIIPLLAVYIMDTGNGWRRAAYIGALVPIAGCLYLTYSRGAWLLAVPAALLFIGLVRGGKTLWALLGAVTAALLGLVPVLGVERVRSLLDFREGTTFTRLRLWQAAWNMIRDHPLQGLGLDNFLYRYPQYMLPEAWREPDLSHPHNIVLDYWTRLGLAGVAVVLGLQWGFFRLAWKVYRRAAPWSRTLALGLMASMVGFLVHGLVDNSYFLVDLAFVFFLTAGIAGRLGSDGELAGSPETASK